MIKCILNKIWYDAHHVSHETESNINIALEIMSTILGVIIVAMCITFYPVMSCVVSGIAILLFIIYKTCKYLSYVVDYCQEK